MRMKQTGSFTENGEAATTADVKRKKRAILKNVIILSLAFVCCFTSYFGLSRLQSSIHKEEGLGVIMQSVLYVAFVFSCLLMAKPLVVWIGHKKTIVLSLCGYITWIIANGYATWITMLITSILLGLCAAPVWTAQGSYITLAATRYAKLNEEEQSVVVARFFGIFYMMYSLCDIIGGVISAVILKQPQDNTTTSDEEIALYCGMNDCPWNNYTSGNWTRPSNSTIWLMLAIFAIFAALAVIITALLLDELPDDKEKQADHHRGKCETLTKVFSQMKKPEQLLLIPICIFIGVELAFYDAEFTKSYVTCIVGIKMVGILTIPFSLICAASSVLIGYIIKRTGRLPVFIFAFVTQIGFFLTFFVWTPSANEIHILFMISCLRGVNRSIWQPQINALHGALFSSQPDAAFCNLQIWMSLGNIISFAYSPFLCTRIKIYFMLCVLVVGMGGYLVTEYMTSVKKQKLPQIGAENLQNASGIQAPEGSSQLRDESNNLENTNRL